MTTLPFPRRSLVVSCQARPGNPLRGPDRMALMAEAAASGGATAIRAEGADDVAAIRAAVDLPIIGIKKQGGPSEAYITPTVAAAEAVARAGADLVAVDGTDRPRADGRTLGEQIAAIHDRLDIPVMADVDTFAAGRRAREAAADVVATTLSGYTSRDGPVPEGPDVALVAALVDALDRPVVAEGRYWTPEHVAEAFAAGAYAVVVGTAVTNPAAITRRLARAIPA